MHPKAFTSNDVLTSAWDPYRREAHLMLKRSRLFRGIPRRSSYGSGIIEGIPSELESALVPDEYDDLIAQQARIPERRLLRVGVPLRLSAQPGVHLAFPP